MNEKEGRIIVIYWKDHCFFTFDGICINSSKCWGSSYDNNKFKI